MGALTDSAGMLFKIRADSDQASKEFKKFTKDVKNLEEANKVSFESIAHSAGLSADQFVALKSQILAVTGVIAGVGAVALGAAVGILALTKASADYGSELFDAKIRTGLTAEAISALGFAAKISGSSLETVSGAVSKFNVLVGEAQQGNEKAIATLQKYGITSRETNEAFAQSIEVVGRMTEADQKAVAMRELYKDKTGQMAPIVDQLNGKFKEYIETAKKLGVTLTEEDLKAADEFGDTLDLLGTQAQIVGFKFVSDLMPMITRAMSQISQSMALNQQEAKEWGRDLVALVEGVGVAFTGLKYVSGGALMGLDASFRASGATAISWASVIRTAIESVIAPLFVLIQLGKLFGGVTTGIPEQIAATTGAINARLSLGAAPRIKGVSGGGGGGGKGGGGGAKAAKDDTVKKNLDANVQLQQNALDASQKAYEDTVDNLLEVFQEFGDKAALSLGVTEATKTFQNTAANLLAQLRQFEAQKGALDKETDVQKQVREQKADDRTKKVADAIYDNHKTTNDKIADADLKLADTRREIEKKLIDDLKAAEQELQDTFISNSEDLWDQMIANEEGFLEEQNVLRGEAVNQIESLLVIERDRKLAAIAIEREARKAEIDATVVDEEKKHQLLDALDKLYNDRALLTEEEFQKRKKDIENKYSVPVSGATGPTDAFDIFYKALGEHLTGDKLTAATAGLQMMQLAFQQLGQAVGEAVHAFVLFGSAGIGLRKFTAEMIAQLARMAAVQAIWELAQAAAMFALNFFWPDPKYVKSGIEHLHSAAIYGLLAAGAAGIGRGVAGSAFQQQSGAATGGGATGNSSADDRTLNSGFRGFGANSPVGRQMAESRDALNQNKMVMGQLEETLHDFKNHFGVASPGDVVMRGANDAAQATHNALQGYIADSGAGATSDFRRNFGDRA